MKQKIGRSSNPEKAQKKQKPRLLTIQSSKDKRLSETDRESG